MYRCQIEPAIIATRAPRTILFRDHVQWRCPGGIGVADNSGFFKRAEFRLRNPVFFRIKTARLCKDRSASGFNGVANAVLRIRSPGTVTNDCWKRRKEVADCGSDMRGRRVSESRTWRENGSTSRRFAARKSTPKIGLETAARMKEQMKVRRPKDNIFLIDPQEGMERPSVPVSGGPEGAAEERCGKTLTAVPVSTKKRCS